MILPFLEDLIRQQNVSSRQPDDVPESFTVRGTTDSLRFAQDIRYTKVNFIL